MNRRGFISATGAMLGTGAIAGAVSFPLISAPIPAWQMDIGVGKRISLSERASLQFRSEFFNIFNHPQYGLPQATFGVPGFGSIIQTVNTTTPVSPVGSGTPREIQFSVRVRF